MTGCGGLSGEHIQLCAEGARQDIAESLRQVDGDAYIFYAIRVSRQSVYRAAFLFGNISKESW